MSTRHMWGLPVQAHRYLIEELGGQHAQTMLIIRYVKFLQSLRRSPKMCVQFLLQKVYKNVNTVTGKNVEYILSKTSHECDVFSVTPNKLKKNLRFNAIRNQDRWRVNMIKEIVNIKQDVLTLDGEGFTSEELNNLLDYISTT